MNDSPFGSASEGSVSSGQDTSELEEDVAQEEITQLNVEIPTSLHRRLKVVSARRDVTMREVVITVLDRHLDT